MYVAIYLLANVCTKKRNIYGGTNKQARFLIYFLKHGYILTQIHNPGLLFGLCTSTLTYKDETNVKERKYRTRFKCKYI